MNGLQSTRTTGVDSYRYKALLSNLISVTNIYYITIINFRNKCFVAFISKIFLNERLSTLVSFTVLRRTLSQPE